MANKKKWTKRELERFRKLILNRRKEVLADMGDLKDNAQITNEYSSGANSTYSYHMADAGTDQGEREKAYYWLARENNYLRYHERALQMIEDGTFGICQTCGNLIDKERLEEVPHTTACFSCKSKNSGKSISHN